MKTTILALAMAFVLFSACKSNSNTNKNDTVTQTKSGSYALKNTIYAYLELKNALAADDTQKAASAGNSLAQAIGNIDKSSLSAKQAKVFADVVDDLKENAEHIGTNAGKIKHQREHFEMLSKEVYDLVKADKNTGAKLYYAHCPMYNSGKGANWISETKEIHNPYLGKQMPDCGSVKEELN